MAFSRADQVRDEVYPAQWTNAGLACTWPWVQSLVLRKGRRTVGLGQPSPFHLGAVGDTCNHNTSKQRQEVCKFVDSSSCTASLKPPVIEPMSPTHLCQCFVGTVVVNIEMLWVGKGRGSSLRSTVHRPAFHNKPLCLVQNVSISPFDKILWDDLLTILVTNEWAIMRVYLTGVLNSWGRSCVITLSREVLLDV